MKNPIINRRGQRFVTTGIGVTAFDIAVYTIFVALLGSPILANYLSTSLAFTLSYTLNKRFVFRSHAPASLRQVSQFIITTLIGLWLIQPLLIWLFTTALPDIPLGFLLAKLVATAASATWNYFMYSRLVFRDNN